jgi:glycosyltransferase involved in cell wall biosynthesis
MSVHPFPNETGVPLVSVVMCTYNGAAFLLQQIESILAQTYPHFELVIVDDASADETRNIIAGCMQTDRRIRCFVNEDNIGYNRNFEKAIALADGDFIAISDQDDIWHADKLRIMMEAWPEGAKMIYSISSDFDSGHPQLLPGNPHVQYKNFTDPAMLVFDSPVHGHACMVKKDFALKCRPYYSDIFYDWWLSMFAANEGALGFVNHTLTWHRVHGRNFSRNLTSVADKHERLLALRRQKIYFIDSILKRCQMPPTSAALLHTYKNLLEQSVPGKFSSALFQFFVKNRHVVYHYKKKLRLFSVLKRSYRRSFYGL